MAPHFSHALALASLALCLAVAVGVDYQATSFSVITGYNGTLNVAGRVTVSQSTTMAGLNSQVLTYSLTGADPLCVAGSIPNITNACGVHIHAGSSCASSAGHYWNNTAVTNDPWLAVTYSGANATGNGVTVTTGYDNSAVSGHAFVVHDSAGAKAACGLLTAVNTGSVGISGAPRQAAWAAAPLLAATAAARLVSCAP